MRRELAGRRRGGQRTAFGGEGCIAGGAMRRWLKRIGLGLPVLVLTLATLGTGYEQWSRRHVARTLAPAGRLIDVGGHRLHLDCAGAGTPTVVLSAGPRKDG